MTFIHFYGLHCSLSFLVSFTRAWSLKKIITAVAIATKRNPKESLSALPVPTSKLAVQVAVEWTLLQFFVLICSSVLCFRSSYFFSYIKPELLLAGTSIEPQSSQIPQECLFVSESCLRMIRYTKSNNLTK